MESLTKFESLWSLNIQGTKVQDFSPLAKLPKLKNLSIGSYLSKKEYDHMVPVSDLGLNWKSYSSEEDVQSFLKSSKI